MTDCHSFFVTVMIVAAPSPSLKKSNFSIFLCYATCQSRVLKVLRALLQNKCIDVSKYMHRYVYRFWFNLSSTSRTTNSQVKFNPSPPMGYFTHLLHIMQRNTFAYIMRRIMSNTQNIFNDKFVCPFLSILFLLAIQVSQ